MRRANRPLFKVGVGVVALAALGCGAKRPGPAAWQPIECYPVVGEVRVKGQPAAGARLTLYPDPPRPDELTWPAVTDADGKFTCGTNADGDGLPPGRYVATVTWPEELRADRDAETDRLGKRYASPKSSRLRVEVKPGPNQFPPFQLP